MVKEFEKKSEEFWDNILNGEKNLTDEEAKDMEKIIIKIRKENGFRE